MRELNKVMRAELRAPGSRGSKPNLVSLIFSSSNRPFWTSFPTRGKATRATPAQLEVKIETQLATQRAES